MRTEEIMCSGYSVIADIYESSRDQIVLSLIGWTSNRKRYQPMMEAVVRDTGATAIVFDYSGHGDSPFLLEETRPAQQFLEVIQVFDWVKEQYPGAKISVIGTSYGGFLATQLTKYREFKKLILRVPAIYKPEDFYTLWKDFDIEWARGVYRKEVEQLEKHPLLARALRFQGKTFVLVHGADELVPKETTDAYIKAFQAESHTLPGFTHSPKDLSYTEWNAYHKLITNWIKSE